MRGVGRRGAKTPTVRSPVGRVGNDGVVDGVFLRPWQVAAVEMSQRSGRRRVVAALLSVLQPGIGHAYLREWLRAVLWGLLWLGSLVAILASTGVELSARNLLATAAGFFGAVENFPMEAAVAMFAITVFASMDAYRLAAREDHRIGETPRCPNCGRELDPSLKFCHWCTTRLEDR